jgi:hypothetical protein
VVYWPCEVFNEGAPRWGHTAGREGRSGPSDRGGRGWERWDGGRRRVTALGEEKDSGWWGVGKGGKGAYGDASPAEKVVSERECGNKE